MGYVFLLLIDKRGCHGRTPFAGEHWTLTWDLADSSGKVICSNIHSFKGLERPVVVVSEIRHTEASKRTELMYAALSRAREFLVLAGSTITATAG